MTTYVLGNHGTGNCGVTTVVGRVVVGSVLVVASFLGSSTTSNASPSPRTIERTSAVPSNTLSSSSRKEKTTSTARGILAIRQIANLTWDETAKIFGVSRRSVHLWANGRHPSGDQERKLNKILGMLSSFQYLGPSSLRERLMASAAPGTLYFDLLCNDEFEAFQNHFAPENLTGQTPTRALPMDVSKYTPQPPILLLEALQDRPVLGGKAIARKSVRIKREVS